MGRGKTGLRVRPSRLFSLVARFSGPAVVLTSLATAWMAIAWTDTITLKGATSSIRSTRQLSQAPMVRRIGSDGRPLWGVRHDNLGPNWSGYVVARDTYTSAQGTWTVPAVSWVDYPPDPQGRAISESSATWIGIGGALGDGVLIQLGTQQALTSSGIATYGVWYELYPAPPITIDASRFVVSPGDTMTASLQCTAACTPNAESTWVLSMTNVNRWKTPFTVQVQDAPTNLATAEWIMEANGAYCNGSACGPTASAYLPNFGPTTFTAISANNKNPQLLRSQDAMMITDPEGKAWSVPSDPVGGNSFTVTFGRPPSP